MKESAVSERKAESSSAMRRKEAASLERDGRGAADQPLMSIVQRGGCGDCGPSMRSMAGEMMQIPGGQRRAAAMSLQRARGNSFVQRMAMQAKLVVGPADDEYEREANRVARQVVETIMSSNQKAVQREEVEEEEEELRCKVNGLAPAGGIEVGPDLESAIQRVRGGGLPLSEAVRRPMERAFGADFGGVRVHTNREADSLNRSLQARAFTTGQDIFLRQGEYRPGSSGGQRLLAHELTHVMQQNGIAVQRAQMQATRQVIQRYPVVRGGMCTAGNFSSGSGVTVGNGGKLRGISTQSDNMGKMSWQQLSSFFRNTQVGVTEDSAITNIGGEIVHDGNPGNPYHATVNNLTAQEANNIFTPTRTNPNRRKD